MRGIRHPRTVLATVVSALAVLVGGTAAAVPTAAAPAFVSPNISNADLAVELNAIVAQSSGRVQLSSIGTTNEGRPIQFARVGHGPVRLLYVTQQHGDEPLGTPAAVAALRDLGVPDTASNRQLLDQITLGVIVRANPDGHAHGWRHNFDPTADPEFGQKGEGYDINRYHNPSLLPENNPVPEAAAIQRTFGSFNPSVFVDYHMQGRCRLANNRLINVSLLWPTNSGVASPVIAQSKRVTVKAKREIALHNGVLSKYPGDTFDGIARNAYGLRGSASLLLELSNLSGSETVQMNLAHRTMLAIAKSAGDGTLSQLPAAEADQLPARGACSSVADLDHDHDHAG